MQPVINKPVPTSSTTPREFSNASYSMVPRQSQPTATNNRVPGESDLSGALRQPDANAEDFKLGGRFGDAANGR
jgi:hypothetical protein